MTKSSKLPKIFVVDDDEGLRQALSSLLRSVGYEVELFESGIEMFERVEDGNAGCILLDVRLPGISGIEVQKRLVEAGNSTPIVFMTGHGDVPMVVQAMKAGAVEFFTKPFRDQDLLDAVSLALERDARRRSELAERQDTRKVLGSLSPRELEVFSWLCQGRIGKQIAYALDLSEGTVKVHRRNIMNKLNVATVSEMILRYSSFIMDQEAHAPH